MGLLDEAIREHLELRRRRGANPREVEREEQEALQPIGSGELPAWATTPAILEAPAEEVTDSEAHAPFDATESGQLKQRGPIAPSQAPLPALDDETAELDMAALLENPEDQLEGGEGSGAAPSEPPAGGRFRARRMQSQSAVAFAEGLDWEVPGRRESRSDAQQTAQESLALE